jgi:hypothetical protein
MSADKNVCTKCIRDQRFNKWIRENGRRGACDFDPSHGRARKVIPVREFAEKVDEYFRETYRPADEESYVTADSDNIQYRPGGEPYEDILMYELDCDDDVRHDIIDNLPDVSHRELSQGADPFYTDAYGFERIADAEEREKREQEEYWYERRFTLQWQDFCEKVQYERRFFNIKEPLDALLSPTNTRRALAAYTL